MRLGLTENALAKFGTCLSSIFRSRENKDFVGVEGTVLIYAEALWGLALK